MVSPLTHKLLRDLWRMKGQAIAIGLVIAVGVALQVMMSGVYNSVEETRRAYYERYRLADMFAPVMRAPDRLIAGMSEIAGVAGAQGRVTGAALIDIPGQPVPVQARAVSLPDHGAPRLNDVYLTDGRLLNPSHSDEILLLESFANAHDLSPGDTLRATMNGAQRAFVVVGLAQSPEFLYTTAPGEMVPDDARFGVIWMSRSALSAAYDMQGAFNEMLLSLTRGADEQAVMAAVDDVLDPYGGQGAYGVADQFSNMFIQNELTQLEQNATWVPPVFLAVAAFLLNIVITRMVQAEREEIGLMKAFGYTNWEVGSHYFKLILTIAIGGALAGCLLGIAGGRGMVEQYLIYFKFPFLVFQLDPRSFVIGVSVSVLAASAGGILVLRQVFALTPSQAMRPPAPPDYSRSSKLSGVLARYLDQPTRIVLRRITRQPLRMAGAMFGIAAGMALSSGMLTIFAAFNHTIDLTFTVENRADISVAFVQPVSDKTLFELRNHPGIHAVEPMRSVSVVHHNGRFSERGAITGLSMGADLYRAIDANEQSIAPRSDGIILSTTLARKLAIEPGDMLTVEVREGRQPVLDLPVVGIAEAFLGMPAYMEIDALSRALGEPGRVSGAYLSIDDAFADDIYRWLKDLPVVAGVSPNAQAQAAFEKMLNEGAGAVRYVMGTMAFIITFGIVYNAARIAYAERARDLASLRVIGFTKGEAAFVLLGELGLVTAMALPIGALGGHYLSLLLARAFSGDLFHIPVLFSPESLGFAGLVVIVAAIVSGVLVKRDLDRAELVLALKTRE